MLNILKPILAFVISLAVLMLFYYFFSIPILPCITVYMTVLLFAPNPAQPCFSVSRLLRTVVVLLITAIGVFLYAGNLYVVVRTAEHVNFLFIITEALTAISFIGAFLILNGIAKNSR